MLVGIALLFAGAQTARATQPRQLTLAERVAYQYAIEEVYWRHRIWPKENPGLKPPLDEVMPAAQIEKKVEDYLRNSQLLVSYWQRPITPEQLQAEMERMASQTKQPEVLQELFAALGNDPFLIAECLTRPVLSERWVKNLYVHDERIHGELKRRAESQLRSYQSVEDLKQISGMHSEVEWIKGEDAESSRDGEIVGHAHRFPLPDSDGGAPAAHRQDSQNTIRMITSEWDESIRKLAAQFSNMVMGRARPECALSNAERGAPLTKDTRASQDSLDRIKTGTLSQLQEDDGRYYATVVMEKGKDRLKLATVAWAKEPFESWAAKMQIGLSQAAGEPVANYAFPAIATSSIANPLTSCIDNTWTPTEVSNSYPIARSDHTVIWTGSEMIIWGGGTNTGSRYNPITDNWAATSTTSAPAARGSHTAVWTGSEMIVWGGFAGSNELNTGGKYNPSTDSWISASTNNAPIPRYWHTAVWTGSQMIIWGGYNGSAMNTGGRYNPTTDSWLATSINNAPAARQLHAAVWTGSEMIIWGGSNITGDLNTGGKYNPSVDNWAVTSISNAPAARTYHTAVWTGSEMIVWGGSNGSVLNSGGRYNPSTGSWLATTTASAPTARSSHTAVWTGSEMIVWGGEGTSTYLNSGGKYDPVTNMWGATGISASTPPGRGSHTAVWTGSEMIVWGGHNNSAPLDTGGRFNPTTDSWIALVSTNSPSGRSTHAAVWTGSEMIVWGGFGGGARFNPNTGTWVATTNPGTPISGSNLTAIWTGTEMIVWGWPDPRKVDMT